MAKYDAFLSYASRASKAEATALQQGLQRFGKKWHELMALRVFRDDAALSASPSLWKDIETGLKESEWFILLLSPAAASSSWVNQEVAWWLEHRSMNRMLLVHDDGAYSLVNHQFTAETDCIPEALLEYLAKKAEAGEIQDEPRITDFSWFDGSDSLRENDPRYWDAIADLSCAIQGKSKLEVHGNHVAERRRARSLARSAIVGLSFLLIAALIATFLAFRSSEKANAELASRIASDLSSRAILLRNEAPRSAALSALAANAIKPSAATANAMGSVAEANLGVQGSIKVANSAITSLASDRVWTLASVGDDKLKLIRWPELKEYGDIELSAPVVQLAEFSTPSEHRFVAILKTGSVQLVTIDGDGAISLSEMGQLASGEDVVWAGVIPATRERKFAVVTDAGVIQTWRQEGDSSHSRESQRICSDEVGAEVKAATNDNRYRVLSSKLYLWCSRGNESVLVEVDMGLKTPEVEAKPVPNLFRVQGLAVTDAGVVVGAGDGLHLLDEYGGISYPYAGVTSSVEKLGTDGYSILVATQGETYLFEDEGDPIARKRGSRATSISHTTARGHFLGYADGTVVETEDLWTSSDEDFAGSVESFAFTRDGSFLSVGRHDNSVKMLRKEPLMASGEDSAVNFAVPDGAQIFQIESTANLAIGLGESATGELQLITWDLDGGVFNDTYVLGAGTARMAVSSSGELLAVAHEESSTLFFFSLPDLKPIKEVALDTVPRQLGFIGDEVLGLVDSGSEGARLIRVGSGPKVVEDPQPGMHLLAVSPDGESYATVTGPELSIFDKYGNLTVSASRDLFIKGIEWSNHGKMMALWSGGAMVTLLDGATLSSVAPDVWYEDGAPVARVAVREEQGESDHSTEITMIASDAEEQSSGSIKKYEITQMGLKEQLCRIAGSSFTRAEWSGVVGDQIPYQDLCPAVLNTLPSLEESSQAVTMQSSDNETCGPPDGIIIKYTEHPEGKVVRRSCKEDDGWFVYEAETYFFDNPNQLGQGIGLMRFENGEWEHYLFLERRYCNQLVWLNKDLQPEGLPLWVQDEFDCRDVIEEFPNGFEEP